MASRPSKKCAELDPSRFNKSIQLVSFRVGSEDFVIDVHQVQEILRMVEITDAPRTRSFVSGVINLRGKIVPVVDLRQRFELAQKRADESTRIVVVDVDGHVMGLVVDSVTEVIRLPLKAIEPPPEQWVSAATDFVKGVASMEGDPLIYLDLKNTLEISEPVSVA
jgi:purine-binding chemotaxis protein CheW